MATTTKTPASARHTARPSKPMAQGTGQPRWHTWNMGDFLMVGMMLAALVPCFQAKGGPGTWLALSLGVAVVRGIASPSFRERLIEGARRGWQRLAEVATPGSSLPWGMTALVVGLPVLTLYWADDRTLGSGDTIPVMMTAISVVRDGDMELREYFPPQSAAPLPYYVQRTSTGIYSSYPAGMNFFAVPVAALAKLSGADLRDLPTFWRLEKLTASLLAAACACLFFLLALHLTSPSAALVMTWFFACGSTQYSTVAQGLWQHGGVVLWGLVILLTEFRTVGRERTGWLSVMQGVAAALMLATRLSAALFLVPWGLWLCWRSPRRAVAVGIIAVLAYLPWALLLYLPVYGTLTGPSLAQAGSACWTLNLAEPLIGVLVSPARGLLVYQPWLLLGLLGAWQLYRSPSPFSMSVPRGWQWVCGIVCVAQIIMTAAWVMWWGGHHWGSRLLADAMPWFALLCVRPVAHLWRTTPGRWLIVLVAALSFLLHFVAIRFHADAWNRSPDVDTHPARIWDWVHPPFLHGCRD
jgi:hypothetical protein